MFVFAVMTIFFFSSCQKEEFVEPISDADLIAQFRSVNGNFVPSDKIIMELYHHQKSGQLKNGTSTISPDAKVGLMAPQNDLSVIPGGGFKQVWGWIISENGWTKDKGILVVYYDSNFEMLAGWDLYIGWDNNQYCTPINIKTTVENIQIRLIFSFPVKGGGNLSFETFSYGEREFIVWLPLLKYDFNWEVMSGAGFGGLMSFDSSNQTELNIYVGSFIDVNTYDYIKFDLKGLISDSKIIIYINDKEGNMVDMTEIILPYGKIIPVFTYIPLTFSPGSINYQIITYPKGMAEHSDWVHKICYLKESLNGNRIYYLE